MLRPRRSLALRGLPAAARVTVLSAAIACSAGPAAPRAVTPIVDLSQPWAHASPADVGMDSAALASAAAAAGAIARFRSLVVARDGRIVLERYYGDADSATAFDVRSVTKSVTSMLTGLALAGRWLPSLDARLGNWLGPPDTLDAGDSAVTVHELLTMTSGYIWDELGGDDYDLWATSTNHVQFLLDRAQTGPPGPFTYNSAAVHVLGVMLQRAVGRPLARFADSALFAPIGVTSASWEPADAGTVNGGSGLQLTARDLLRLGQLALQSGRSGDLQVVPAAWVRAMTTAQFPWRETDGPQSGVTYGYLWWVVDRPGFAAYFAWGYGGQYVYVVPALDLVVVTTTEWRGLGTPPAEAQLGYDVMRVIVNDVLPATVPARAARRTPTL